MAAASPRRVPAVGPGPGPASKQRHAHQQRGPGDRGSPPRPPLPSPPAETVRRQRQCQARPGRRVKRERAAVWDPSRASRGTRRGPPIDSLDMRAAVLDPRRAHGGDGGCSVGELWGQGMSAAERRRHAREPGTLAYGRIFWSVCRRGRGRVNLKARWPTAATRESVQGRLRRRPRLSGAARRCGAAGFSPAAPPHPPGSSPDPRPGASPRSCPASTTPAPPPPPPRSTR